jgi:hypothetical protein
MTSQIIYHDFRGIPNTVSEPTAETFLNEERLQNGRKMRKANALVHAACIFLCGGCTAVSLLIMLLLMLGR